MHSSRSERQLLTLNVTLANLKFVRYPLSSSRPAASVAVEKGGQERAHPPHVCLAALVVGFVVVGLAGCEAEQTDGKEKKTG